MADESAPGLDDLIPEPHFVVDDVSVRELEPQPALRVGVIGDHLLKLADALAVDQLVVIVDQVETPVFPHSVAPERDAIDLTQAGGLHRGDGKPRDCRHRQAAEACSAQSRYSCQ